MALIDCPEQDCNERFSNTAKECPSCKYDYALHRETIQNYASLKSQLLFIVIIIIALVISYYMGFLDPIIKLIKPK